ncbi:hypothetical protein ETD83_22625 [Actinomadura soli]|uniref:Uncharacterized protein n=1 Tax=Actinomadura soli TaxID=2508997 RepID=A0A5C4J820_9ACTN|nr:hypothetical protein [Actinomadura soli]TMQ95325.1 hypothetical protein ETD83_22625 [Actinomadura soli]
MTFADSELAAEIASLARDALPSHLSAAGRVSQLVRLFEDDRRLLRRVDPTVRVWDGYERDLAIAWEAVDTALVEAPERVAAPLDVLVRFALVRSTLVTTDDLPPALVSAAVDTGCWTVSRALSTIGRLTSPGRRAEGCYRLLAGGQLEQGTRRTVAAMLVELAALPRDEQPSRTLLGGVHLLGAEDRTEIAARIEDTARIDSVRLQPAQAAKLLGYENLIASETVPLLELVPELRRRRLVERLATTLVDALENMLREDRSTAPTEEAATPPIAQLGNDVLRSLVDPAYRLPELCDALLRLRPIIADQSGSMQLLARVDALMAAAQDVGPRGEGEPEDGGYLASIRNIFRRSTAHPSEPTIPNEEDPEPSRVVESLAKVQDRMIRKRLPHGADTPSRDAVPPTPGESDGRQQFLQFAQRAGGAAVIASVATVQKLDDASISTLVSALYQPDELAGQIVLADLIQEHGEEIVGMYDDQPAITVVVRKVKGHLLKCALEHSYKQGGLASAWDGVPEDQVMDADFQPALDLALALPAEAQRHSYWHTFEQGFPANVRSIPRLSALAVLLPYLNTEQMDQVFLEICRIPDGTVRRLGIELVAFRLSRTQVSEAIEIIEAAPDARELGWLFGELIQLLPREDGRRELIERWTAEASALIDGGPDLAEATLRKIERAAGIRWAETMANLRRMDANQRLDAAGGLAENVDGPLPAELAMEIMDLPPVNDRNMYSWRALALVAAAARLSDDWLPAAWQAAASLPKRLDVGDAQMWGWSWQYEYPFAAVVLALAPRLRGPLARRAFEAACEMPWEPREQIFRSLAEHSDTALSGDLFDHAVFTYRSYCAIEGTVKLPYSLEGTYVVQSIDEFQAMREVQLAELIALLAERLDERRMAEATRLACDFSNAGPRSWLPSRLLPQLAPEHRALPLASGLVASLEFLFDDPGRLDLIADLIPYLREELSRRAEPARRFVAQRFPERREGFLLDSDELRSLNAEDVDEYLRLVGIEDKEAMTAHLRAPGDERKREYLREIILRPIFAANLERHLTQVLTAAPPTARAELLRQAADVLEPDTHRAIVEHTLTQLLHAPLSITERLEGLAALLPVLHQGWLDELVEIIPLTAATDPVDESAASRRMFRLFMDDLAESEASKAMRFSDARHNAVVQMARQSDWGDRLTETLGVFHSECAFFLEDLLPQLSPPAVQRLVDHLDRLPDLDLAGPIVMLMPLVDDAVKRRLRSRLRRMNSPLARFWVMFAGQEEFEGGEAEWAQFARDTAELFQDPLSAGASLCLLIGYADEESRPHWREWALSHTLHLDEADTLRLVTAVAATGRRGDESATTLIRTVSGLPPEAAYRGALILARLGIDLRTQAAENAGALNLVISRRLRGLAERGRGRLLRSLAEDAVLFRAMGTDDGVAEIAAMVQDVCVDWRWP